MIPPWMTPEQAYQWRLSLDVKLLRVSGDAFQQFFSDVMARRHGDDFVRTRPWGSAGDKGCDGYLMSTGDLFQCYGKIHDAALSLTTIISKMGEDYGKAAGALSKIMKGWHFVHNLADGLPVDVVTKLYDLKNANPKHRFGFVGPEGIASRIFELREAEIVRLLGPAANASDTQNLRIEEVAGLISAVMAGLSSDMPPAAAPKPVPFAKMEINSVPALWQRIMKDATANAAFVEDYINEHPDPEMGSRLARIFRGRYDDLKLQGLSQGPILNILYEGVTGVGAVLPARQVAAQALLAYLFESCDIFEDDPAKVKL